MRTSNDTRLSPDETERLARFVELDLRTGNIELTMDNVQRVLEGGAQQGNSLYRRAAYGSDAQAKRLLHFVKRQREMQQAVESVVREQADREFHSTRPSQRATKPRTMTVRCNLSLVINLDEYEAEYGETITREDVRAMVAGLVQQSGALFADERIVESAHVIVRR